MSKSKTQRLTLPVMYIAAGGKPEVRTMPYERPEGEPFYEPEYRALKAMLGGAMMERVRLAPGVAIWCDEEGRLKDEPKVVCNVHSPGYCGDMAGECLVVVLEDDAGSPFAPLFTGRLTDEGLMRLAKAALSGAGMAMLYPARPGQVPAEPRFEVRSW